MSFLFLLEAEPPVPRTPSPSESPLFLLPHSTSLTFFSTVKFPSAEKFIIFAPPPFFTFKSVPVSVEFG